MFGPVQHFGWIMASSSTQHLLIRHNSVGNTSIGHKKLQLRISHLEPEDEVSAEYMRLKSFRFTMRALQLDHSNSSWGLMSWIIGFILLILVPILRLMYVRAASKEPQKQLIYQPLVVVVGALNSAASFLFIAQVIWYHGLKGVLFLDTIAEEVAEVRRDYKSAIEQGLPLLAKLSLPAFILYIIQKSWLYSAVELQPLPLNLQSRIADLVIIIVLSTLSWIFQTTTYLYACVLFWKVCTLQELKMTKFKELLKERMDPAFYYGQYVKIVTGMQITSRRFRLFLALIGSICVLGFLASMYEIVENLETYNDIFRAGDLVILNMVNLTGTGLCLKSASRIAHLHRRIVKAASSMHAMSTFEFSLAPFIPSSKENVNLEILQNLERHWDNQEDYSKRAALVTYLSNITVGISVYGFILDRFFVHTSIGGLLTTTWFILGRSLT